MPGRIDIIVSLKKRLFYPLYLFLGALSIIFTVIFIIDYSLINLLNITMAISSLITKLPILISPNNWNDWLGFIRAKCTPYIWIIVNPDVSDNEVEQPILKLIRLKQPDPAG
jgi:hypothetical protein